MKLLELMQQCIDGEKDVLITDGYNNLYMLVLSHYEYSGDYDVIMYEYSPSLGITGSVEVTYDILSNEYYCEI